MFESTQVKQIEHGVPEVGKWQPSGIKRMNHVASFGFWDERKRHEILCDIAVVVIETFIYAPETFFVLPQNSNYECTIFHGCMSWLLIKSHYVAALFRRLVWHLISSRKRQAVSASRQDPRHSCLSSPF